MGYGTQQFVLNPAKTVVFVEVLLLELFYFFIKKMIRYLRRR
jgi:hypothetical protein